MQLNIESFTATKMNVLHYLAAQYEALVILLQETHCTCADKLTIPGFALAGSSLNRKHGLALFVDDRLKWTFVDQLQQHRRLSGCAWTLIIIESSMSTNLHLRDFKCLISQFSLTLYAGDFNCPHVNWGYKTGCADGECLVARTSLNGLVPLHDPKDVATFHSGRWNTGTNSDLTFVSVDLDSRVPERRILKVFPSSQH